MREKKPMLSSKKSTFETYLVHIGLLLVALLLIVPTLAAQVGTGTIDGSVTDPAGLVVPNANVVVKNTQTGAVFNLVTNGQGRYAAPSIPIGTYSVQVQAPGFRSATTTNINLNVGESREVDVALAVGEVSQEISIAADAARIDAFTSTLAGRIGETQMRDLPLNGRNFEQLVVLTPGVVPVTNAASNPYIGRSQVYSFVGARPTGQDEQIDGQNIQNFWNRGAGSAVLGTSLGVDAIAEFQTYTSTASAQFGGANGGMNAVTRSGTNSWHGSGYEFARDASTDAAPYFIPVTGKPDFRRNQFGFTFGGPIKKDKLFFFANYEGMRQTLGVNQTVTIPNQAAQTQVQNYLGTLTPGTAAYNAEQTVLNSLKAIPLPAAGSKDLGNGTSQTVLGGNEKGVENFLTARVDYRISDKDSVFVRSMYDRATLANPYSANSLALYPQGAYTHNQFWALGWTKNITNGLISQAQFNFTRTTQVGDIHARIPAFDCNPTNGYDCFFSVPSLSTDFGINTPNAPIFDYIQNKFEPKEQLFWMHGTHAISIGVSAMRNQTAADTPVNPAGNFYFSSWGYGNTGTPSPNSFLTGQPSSFIGALPGHADSKRNFRELDLTGYIQDSWRLREGLTLNMGLRYAFESNPVEVHNKLFAFVHPYSATDTGYVNVPHPFKTNPSLRNWDPRLGLVWSPFKDQKTVVRAGFAIFHDVYQPRSYGIGYNFSPPFDQVTVPFPAFSVPVVFQCAAAASQCTAPLPSIHDALGYNIDTSPYVVEYNLNLQRELPGGMVMILAYLGSQSSHLLGQLELNPPINSGTVENPVFATLQQVGSGTTLVTNHLMNPNFGSMGEILPIGHSSYNAAQIQVNKPMAHGVMFQTNYTFSHCLDDTSATYSVDNGGYLAKLYPYPISSNRGNCSFDRKHNASINVLYMLPFKGNRLVEGWQLSLITGFHTGLPFTVTCGFDCVGLNEQNSPSLPNINSGVDVHTVVTGNINKYFDPNLFSLQTRGTIGNSPRYAFFGPSMFSDDLALMKNTKIKESASLQLRFETFNILNHPNFSNPSNGLFTGPTTRNPNAGRITSTISAQGGLPSSRQIQFGAKFIF